MFILQKNCRLLGDLNSVRRSRRQARWSVDHNHCPNDIQLCPTLAAKGSNSWLPTYLCWLKLKCNLIRTKPVLVDTFNLKHFLSLSSQNHFGRIMQRLKWREPCQNLNVMEQNILYFLLIWSANVHKIFCIFFINLKCPCYKMHLPTYVG